MSDLQAAFDALKTDLQHPEGPSLSTMRNYRFALLRYDPAEEFALRAQVQRLTSTLHAYGWTVLSISLHALLLERLRAQGDDWIARISDRERRLYAKDPARGLNELVSKVTPLIEGPDGIAADCARVIAAHADAHPEQIDRTVALIGRAGALYPFYRSSALLRHLDGQTRQVPVVLLYPGQRAKDTGLSFMGVLEPDHDYRPRIYP